jgi:hypothetical protein
MLNGVKHDMGSALTPLDPQRMRVRDRVTKR